MRIRLYLILLGSILIATVSPVSLSAAEEPSREEVLATLEKGLTFFASLRVNSGWPMAYSADLQTRWGEYLPCDELQITVQPPATPSVLDAYWHAYEVTGDERWRSVALTAANLLVDGQRANGGWWYEMRFDPSLSTITFYNQTASFDDRVTQGPTQELMRMVRRTGEERYEKAARRALDFMVECRNPGRGWSQLVPANPNSYHIHDTLNDGAVTNVMTTLLMGWRQFGEARYLDAAKAGGDWLIAAQLPEPHRGWAQQYDADGNAAAARWFEPAACVHTCTSNAIDMLCDLFEVTGEVKYLEPIPDALQWLDEGRMTDGPHKGQWPRFREIRTNKPIYFSADKKLVYEPVNLRPGYGWFGNAPVDRLRARYEKLKKNGAPEELRVGQLSEYISSGSRARIPEWIRTQDARGAWVSGKGRIDYGMFSRAIHDLCAGL